MSDELTIIQQESLDRFKKLKVGALFMKMGTGKTRVAIELIKYNNPDYVLYLCPLNTIENVKREFEHWGYSGEVDFFGYETIASSDRRYVELYTKCENYKNDGKKMFIIADESLFIKNGLAKRTIRSKKLRKFFDYALILNGTPITRHEWDIFNQMDFLSEKILNMNYRQFLALFFVEVKKTVHGKKIKFHRFYEPNRPALMKMCAPYIYESDFDFEFDEYEKFKWVPFNSEQYRNTKNNILANYLNWSTPTIIDMFTKLSCIAACNPDKNRAVAEYISGKKLICFCNYKDEVKQIRELCDCYVITGDTPYRQRDKIIEYFKSGENKPLLMMMSCGAFGLNLQFCNEIVYSSLTFNYGNLVQSAARIKRKGQTQDIIYTYILSNCGINRMILRNLDGKISLEEIIKDLIRDAHAAEIGTS